MSRSLKTPAEGEDEGEVGAEGVTMAVGITEEEGVDDAMTGMEGVGVEGALVRLPVVSAVTHVIADRSVVLLLMTAWRLMLVLVLAARHGMAGEAEAAVQAHVVEEEEVVEEEVVVEDMEEEEGGEALARVVALSPILADARLVKGRGDPW